MFNVEYDASRMQYKVYQIIEQDGKRFAVTLKGGAPVNLEVNPGAEVPVYMTIDAGIAAALVIEELRSQRVAVPKEMIERADDATQDARRIRDRLLTMLEES